MLSLLAVAGRRARLCSRMVRLSLPLLGLGLLGLAQAFLPSPSLPVATRRWTGRGISSSSSSSPSRCVAMRAEGWALIFDCDGVILESESLHREAYNKMFQEFQIKYQWSPEYYDELQNMIGGGIPKMRYYFNEYGWPISTLGVPPEKKEEREKMLNVLQDRKNDIYKDIIRTGGAEVRPGILRMVDEVKALGDAKLAICSASTKTSCLFVLDNLLGPSILSKFDLILAGDDVKQRKPHPEIYHMASEKLGVPPERCVVIEDSLIGLQAAVDAGMKCVITYTPSTKDQDFKGAHSVFPELGHSGSEVVTAKQLAAIVGA